MKKRSTLWAQISSDKCWFNISNCLTILRIILAPILMMNMYNAHFKTAFIVFLIAACTDVLDGFAARLFNEQTYLGTFLDPIADKIFLLASFGSLAFIDSPFFVIPTWFIYVIMSRELAIILGAYFLVRVGRAETVTPMIWGKLTTFFQIIFLSWVFVCYFVGWYPSKTYCALLILLTLLSVISFLQYVVRSIRFLLDMPQEIS